MKSRRKRTARTTRPDVYERLSQRLEEFLESERRGNQALWIFTEDEKLTEARLALFGCAPK